LLKVMMYFGAGPLQGSFPPDANGLTRTDRLSLQPNLAARGYDIGTIDGVFGAKTEAAIRDFQQRQVLAVTGIATADVIAALR
jgi:membrane-bound lytic murein transglycosylase B